MASDWGCPLAEPAEAVWLVTGGSGQVGGALAAGAPSHVRIVCPPRDQLDLSAEHLDAGPLIAATGACAIVNCAAYTAVDRAEDEPEIAHRINAAAPAALAAAAAAADIPIVQISTEYVFSGDKSSPYVEEDPTNPQNVYGRTKNDGERAVVSSGARHAILRTSWVFSASGDNFVRTMLRLGKERDLLRIVADQHGCPTHAADLANAIVTVTEAIVGGCQGNGIWHVANRNETSWHGMAERIFNRAAEFGWPAPRVEAIVSAEYPTRAVRPANSRLSTARLQRDFGLELRSWELAVDEAVGEIIAKEGRNEP